MVMNKGTRYPQFYDASIDDETLDPELATETSDGLMSKEDKAKLDSVKVNEDGDIDINISVKASDVILDDDNNFVSKEQIEKWDKNSISIDYNEDEEVIIIN